MTNQQPDRATPVHVAEHPMVTRTTAGTVIIELAGPHAEILAEVLARYDVLQATMPQLEPIKHYSSAVWHHTLIQLLRHVALLRYPIGDTVDVDTDMVDLDRLTHRGPQLQVLRGGAR